VHPKRPRNDRTAECAEKFAPSHQALREENMLSCRMGNVPRLSLTVCGYFQVPPGARAVSENGLIEDYVWETDVTALKKEDK
jgi:hypothetical protein